MKIGFMQGRLSDLVGGKIQAFPWSTWEKEFKQANQIGFKCVEWTLDHQNLRKNPLLTSGGQKKIMRLSRTHKIAVTSVTGDCFMQAPFHKANGAAKVGLLEDLELIIRSSEKLGISCVVVPLVDNGSVTSDVQRASLIDGMLQYDNLLRSCGIKIAFESDFEPRELSRFISEFPKDTFSINYDTGNSASMGFDPVEEFSCYGSRVFNVHIKDRVLGGGTVPLGDGAANFPLIFNQLKSWSYSQNIVLQTARAANGNHAAVLTDYFDMVTFWAEASGLKTQ